MSSKSDNSSRRIHCALSLFGILALAPLACWSQSGPTITSGESQAISEGGRPGGDWRISVGAGAVVTPRFIGANKLRTLGVPTFDLHYRDWFFANPIKGIGLETHPVTGLSLTAAVGVDLSSRTSSEDPRLRGLPKNDFAPALKLGAEYEFHDFTINAELSQRLASSAKSGAKARFRSRLQLHCESENVPHGRVFRRDHEQDICA